MSAKPPHNIYLNYKQPLICFNETKISSIGCSSVILQDFLFPYPYVEKITEK